MIKKVFFLFFWSTLLLAVPARADWLSNGPSSVDIQKALSGDTVTVEGYELARDDLKRFYLARAFKPAWNFNGAAHSETFSAFMDSIVRLVDYHGLVRDDYAFQAMRKLDAAKEDDSQLKLELLVTDTLLRLAHDLHGDSVDLAELYVGWNLKRNDADIPAEMADAVAYDRLKSYIDSLVPKNPSYTQLAVVLQKYRDLLAHGGWGKIDAGPSLKPKDRGPRVTQLRARLIAEDYLPQTDLTQASAALYDDDLRQAVITYQNRNSLSADGNVGAKALEALNTSLQTRIDQIRANMERWRHMPDDFPPQRYALVNIPDASLVIVDHGQPIYHGIVIVGRVDRKTPFIQSKIRSMIINPAWHVPAKIARQDILPKLRKDPHYLEKLGFVIRDNEDDPHGDNIDWKSMPEQEFNFRLRQSPGDQNSLGRLKFDFDNDFAVYMHGTPHQELFQKSERALSSGCVRLHDPEQVAEIFLAHNKEHWDVQKLDDEINGGKTHWIALADPMPLNILYWTVFVDDAGQINFRKDVYAYDSFLIENMRQDNEKLPSP